MRVLIAGASGAIGAPLARQLIDAGHEVLGVTRTPGNAPGLTALGARPVVADVLDRSALLRAVNGLTADAIVHEGTDLKRVPIRYAGMTGTNALRTTGTANLLAAARALGARRFLTQSIVLGYGFRDHGERTLTEQDPFAEPVPGPLGATLAAMRANEQQVFDTPGIEGVALRYGMFYGPRAGLEQMVESLRRRRFPVPSDGGGLASMIYVEDAAAATVAALERGRAGEAYNVVDDEAVRWGELLDALADAAGTPRPPRMPGWVMRAVPYARAFLSTSMRVSNAKARDELGWKPAVPTYREGIRAALQSAAAG